MGALAILVAATSYGLVNSVIKTMYAHGLNIVHVTLSQSIAGTLLVLLMLSALRIPIVRVTRLQLVQIVGLGIIGQTVSTIAMNLALERLSAAISIILLFQFVWITVVIEWFVTRRAPRPAQQIAVAIVLIGTVLAVGVSPHEWRHLSATGIAWGLLSGVGYAVFLSFSGRVAPAVHPFQKAGMMMLGSMPVTLATLVLSMPTPVAHALADSPHWAIWALPIAILSVFIPVAGFNWGLARVDASYGAVLGAFELPVSIFGSVVFLGERVSYIQYIGIALILIGIYISERWHIKSS
jgi:drug/metabolite transporter (DMT)-like permease